MKTTKVSEEIMSRGGYTFRGHGPWILRRFYLFLPETGLWFRNNLLS